MSPNLPPRHKNENAVNRVLLTEAAEVNLQAHGQDNARRLPVNLVEPDQ